MGKILYSILVCCLAQYVSAQCTPIITPQGNTIFCDGNDVTLSGSLGDTYQWYLNGNTITGANSDTYVATAAGDYTVEIDSVGCVATSAPVTVTVNTVPAQPGVITGNTTICSNSAQTYMTTVVPGATSYVWYKGCSNWNYNFSDTTTTPTVSGVLGHSYIGSSPAATLTVRALNECGASAASSIALSIYTPVMVGGTIQPWDLDITNTETGYCPQYVPPYTWLFASWHPEPTGYSTATAYEWYRNGVVMPNQVNQKATITRGGNYAVKVFCGPCATTLNKGFVKQCVPRATIYPQNSINACLDSNVMLSVVFDEDGWSGTNYAWSWYLNGTQIPGSQNVDSITPVGPGSYSVKINSGSCQVNDPYECQHPANMPLPVMVTVPPPLEVTQIDDTLFATPGYDTYQWFESGALLAGETNQKLVLTVDGYYTVEGVFMNGCLESSDSFDADFILPPPNEENENQEPTQPPIDLAGTNIYPNPSNGTFTVYAEVPVENTSADISIMDMTGHVIFIMKVAVKDGIVKQEVTLPDNIYSVGVLKVKAKGYSKTAQLLLRN